MSKVKICGLFREIDIEYVNDCKPDFAGFIVDFPKSHRNIDLKNAKNLITKLDKKIKSVCVIVDNEIEDAIKIANICDVIQLHGNEDEEYIKTLRNKISNTQIWKAFKIRSKSDLIIAQKSSADMILLDNGYGTGEVFDWSIIEKINRNFILAGGLNSQNISGAIEQLKPYCVDLSSSVETEKKKDFKKIKEIIDIVRSDKNE